MNEQNICCPRFEPALWDGKTFEWDNKRFIRDKVFTLFYMPMNFGGVMKRIHGILQKSGAQVQDGMWLSDHSSPWNMDLYLAVDKQVAGAQNTTISGKFFCKSYEGEYKDAGKWMKDFENGAKSKGMAIRKMYLWYTSCPQCSKKYGHNYVAIFGQIS